jgi:hypothetical protein
MVVVKACLSLCRTVIQLVNVPPMTSEPTPSYNYVTNIMIIFLIIRTHIRLSSLIYHSDAKALHEVSEVQ